MFPLQIACDQDLKRILVCPFWKARYFFHNWEEQWEEQPVQKFQLSFPKPCTAEYFNDKDREVWKFSPLLMAPVALDGLYLEKTS